MQLRMKSSDCEACTHALRKMNASTIENATRCWLLKLLKNRCNHEESQSNCKDDDENKASKVI